MESGDKMKKIPIMFCFDNNYVIQAAVSMHSMLKYANKQKIYILYVLHTDITTQNQNKLHWKISQIDCEGLCLEDPKLLEIESHFANFCLILSPWL